MIISGKSIANVMKLACVLVSFSLANTIGCSDANDNKIASPSLRSRDIYTLPSSLVLNSHADRTQDGGIVISGTTNLPDGLKIWIEVELGRLPLGAPKVVASDENVIISGGSFRSNPLWMEAPNTSFKKTGWPKAIIVNVRQKPFAQGPEKVRFESYFNGAWQTSDVLAALGNDEGKNLKGPILKATDPDVVDSPKVVNYLKNINFPPMSSEANAINLVRGAVLTIPGDGRSAGDVQANLDLYMRSPGLSISKGWSAKHVGPTEFQVNYDFINGVKGDQQATWQVNTVSRSVKYVNENAKIFSWTPKY